MKADLFDFELPESAIALVPVEPRDLARMLIVDPEAASPFTDAHVGDLVQWLKPGDALVFNDTRVIPAALEGQRVRDGAAAKVSFNLLRRVDGASWRALARPQKRLAVGDDVLFGKLAARVSAKLDAGEVELKFALEGADLDRAIDAVGAMPLPPYIALKRAPDARDRERYQTVYAAKDGAVAAPTAGLHFTPALLAKLRDHGVSQHFVTLHVGAGTFLPVKVEDTRDHKMHSEWGEVSDETVARLIEVKAKGGRIVAVGTTSLRLLETAAQSGTLKPFRGDTAIFISPGYRFNAIDALMTNFHLPRSTLFMLVSAFSGLKTMKAAYTHAINTGYRFYSYGDASLLFPVTSSRSPHRDTQ